MSQIAGELKRVGVTREGHVICLLPIFSWGGARVKKDLVVKLIHNVARFGYKVLS